MEDKCCGNRLSHDGIEPGKLHIARTPVLVIYLFYISKGRNGYGPKRAKEQMKGGHIMASFTRKAIMDSCLRLLEERPVDKITVKDIVEDCGINRNTFYYHFEDLPSLIHAIFMEDAERIIQESIVINSLWECFESVFRFALKRRRVVMHVYHSSNRAVFEQQLFMICQHTVTQYVERVIADLGGVRIREDDRRIIIQAYTCECYGQIMSWLNSSMKEDFLQDIIRLCKLREGEVRELLLRSSQI